MGRTGTVLRIGILGAGSVGCFVGGRLSARGHDVIFVGRDRVRRKIQSRSGLILRDLGGRIEQVPLERFRFETEISSLVDREFILCCLKSAQTAEAGGALAGVLPSSSSAVIVSLQNGMGNQGVLRSLLRHQAVLGGIVGFNVRSEDDGEFRRTTSGKLIIEEGPPGSRARILAAALSDAGFGVRVEADIRPLQWSKLVINLANAVSALSGRPTKELLLDAGYRQVIAAITDESLRVLRLAGVRLGRLGPIPTRAFPLLLRLPTPVVKVLAHAIDPDARSSMWEDLTRGRRTEVDYLNGEIVRLAKSSHAEAPLNARVVQMVHAAEEAGKGVPGLSATALWQSLLQP